MLSVKRLYLEYFSLEQIYALRYCITLLRDSAPDDAAEERASQQLFDCGLPPLVSFDDNGDTLLQLYLDEL